MWGAIFHMMRMARDAVIPPREPAPPLESAPANGWEPWDGPLEKRPHNRAEMIALLGDPTRGQLYLKKPDPKWVKANIVELHGPTAFLPVLAKSYFPIHRLIEPYAREAFRRAEISCPGVIRREGTWGYNFRRIRHDTPEKAKAAGRPLRPLSLHSYGCAIDVNPDWNGGKQFGPGDTPTPWSVRWMKIWPQCLPREIVLAFESCGFEWGGRWRGYCDPMHFEWIGHDDVRV